VEEIEATEARFPSDEDARWAMAGYDELVQHRCPEIYRVAEWRPAPDGSRCPAGRRAFPVAWALPW
jgi:hypothetical protein